jgi:hypothetical protein
MEVASASDPIEDVLKFRLELAPILPAGTRWRPISFDQGRLAFEPENVRITACASSATDRNLASVVGDWWATMSSSASA